MSVSQCSSCPEWNSMTSCAASGQMIEKATADGASTMFHRAQTSKPCPIGSKGLCCSVCGLGPCRVTEDDDNPVVGVCGATAATIAARNFARMVAAGTAAHSDHGREIVELFIAVAKGEAPGYEIKDVRKLHAVATEFGIDVTGKEKNAVALELGEKALGEFGKQHGELTFLSRAPAARQEKWRKLGIAPRGIDREVVELLHRTSVGVDQDYKSILMAASRTALADGWGGSMIATELQDIMFGTPVPVRSKVNLGVLKADQVNIIVHGHDPIIPESMVQAAREPEMLELAASVGATGINISGICCTANEILMRHGIPIAGNYVQQELAIATGAVEAMVVDVQCCLEALPEMSKCYHTEIFTTSDKARITGATHLEFEPGTAFETAKELLRRAIANFPNRGVVEIPSEVMDMVVGFSHETINYILGGHYRSSYRPLNDNIINGKIRGLVAVAGCNNPRQRTGAVHSALFRELIANDVLVLATGCAAITAAKEGLMRPEAAELAGAGLREVCEAVGIPPVLHCGSCVDNSRLLVAACGIQAEGGFGDDMAYVPAAGCAPEWMSEKAIAIGHYFVSSGVMVVFGNTWPTLGSDKVSDFLFREIEEYTDGHWVFEPDPLEMARILIERIDFGRSLHGYDKARERVLFDMDMRRELDV